MKLPIDKVLLGAVLIPWWNRTRFLTALLVPGLLIAALQLGWSTFPDDLPRWVAWLAWGVNILLYVLFAVVCHRLVLLDVAPERRGVRWTMRETRFTAFTFGIMVLSTLAGFGVVFIVGTPVLNILTNLSNESAGPIALGMSWTAKVIGSYVMGRLCLVLPATAVDTPLRLADSWAATRGNGWRLAFVVGALPWVLDELTGLIYREGATVMETVVFATLCVLALTVEIAALSVSYKKLSPRQPPPVNDAAAGATQP